MLEIKPCTEKNKLAAYCKACGELPGSAYYAYTAADRGKEIAWALFKVLSDSVRVLCYNAEDPGDYWLFDGILRAGFNYAADEGLATGCIPEPFRQEHKALFAKLNYPINPEFDISNFFKKYKNCKG